MTRPCTHCGDTFHPAHTWHHLCWHCWRTTRDDAAYTAGYRDGAQQHARTTFTTPDEPLLRDAIALCHPDRHPPNRAEQANRTTSRLLELLQLQRAAA